MMEKYTEFLPFNLSLYINLVDTPPNKLNKLDKDCNSGVYNESDASQKNSQIKLNNIDDNKTDLVKEATKFNLKISSAIVNNNSESLDNNLDENDIADDIFLICTIYTSYGIVDNEHSSDDNLSDEDSSNKDSSEEDSFDEDFSDDDSSDEDLIDADDEDDYNSSNDSSDEHYFKDDSSDAYDADDEDDYNPSDYSLDDLSDESSEYNSFIDDLSDDNSSLNDSFGDNSFKDDVFYDECDEYPSDDNSSEDYSFEESSDDDISENDSINEYDADDEDENSSHEFSSEGYVSDVDFLDMGEFNYIFSLPPDNFDDLGYNSNSDL